MGEGDGVGGWVGGWGVMHQHSTYITVCEKNEVSIRFHAIQNAIDFLSCGSYWAALLTVQTGFDFLGASSLVRGNNEQSKVFSGVCIL